MQLSPTLLQALMSIEQQLPI